ncbi:MAG: sigma-70 family RNA polymerase sigma factor [Verrucomicrobia bacterium]|nr:sigma-70 family RNA polymerase sigma factor [Verrucomicrobiota bacterium]
MRPNDETSAEHMRALVAGRKLALNDLMALWEAPLLRFIFRYVQNDAEARDLVQETFVRVYLHRERFRPESSFSTWAFTIAANLCRNHHRWRGRHPTVSLDEPTLNETNRHDQIVCPGSSPDRSAQQNERIDALKAAIADLPHDLRTALLLYEYEELTYREIATIAGCSEKGVESRLVRARAHLRKKLSVLLGTSRPPQPILMPQRG